MYSSALPHNGADAPEEKGDGRSFGVSFRVLRKEIKMLKNTFVERGTFARLSPSKRIIRGVFGGALIAYFIWQLPKYGMLVNTDFPVVPGKWIGMAILFYFFAWTESGESTSLNECILQLCPIMVPTPQRRRAMAVHLACPSASYVRRSKC